LGGGGQGYSLAKEHPEHTASPPMLTSPLLQPRSERLERQGILLEKLLGTLLNKQHARADPVHERLIDYLSRQLAAEDRIREGQLSKLKRRDFGPPRTCIGRLVAYRRGLDDGHLR
jgi:hypothetical protein